MTIIVVIYKMPNNIFEEETVWATKWVNRVGQIITENVNLFYKWVLQRNLKFRRLSIVEPSWKENNCPVNFDRRSYMTFCVSNDRLPFCTLSTPHECSVDLSFLEEIVTKVEHDIKAKNARSEDSLNLKALGLYGASENCRAFLC